MRSSSLACSRNCSLQAIRCCRASSPDLHPKHVQQQHLRMQGRGNASCPIGCTAPGARRCGAGGRTWLFGWELYPASCQAGHPPHGPPHSRVLASHFAGRQVQDPVRDVGAKGAAKAQPLKPVRCLAALAVCRQVAWNTHGSCIRHSWQRAAGLCRLRCSKQPPRPHAQTQGPVSMQGCRGWCSSSPRLGAAHRRWGGPAHTGGEREGRSASAWQWAGACACLAAILGAAPHQAAAAPPVD